MPKLNLKQKIKEKIANTNAKLAHNQNTQTLLRKQANQTQTS